MTGRPDRRVGASSRAVAYCSVALGNSRARVVGVAAWCHTSHRGKSAPTRPGECPGWRIGRETHPAPHRDTPLSVHLVGVPLVGHVPDMCAQYPAALLGAGTSRQRDGVPNEIGLVTVWVVPDAEQHGGHHGERIEDTGDPSPGIKADGLVVS